MNSDSQHPFFTPLWRRIAITAFCIGWAAFEFYNRNDTWGWLTLAVSGYAVYTFFIAYKAPEAETKPGTQDDANKTASSDKATCEDE